MPLLGSIGSKTIGGAASAPKARRIPASQRNRAKSVCLVEIALLNSGPTLYLSDRNVTVRGQRYEDYLSDLTGPGEELSRRDSEGLNSEIDLEFDNSRYRGYGCLIEAGEAYPFEGAECVIKTAWLDDDGELLELETVFKGSLDEPCEITLSGFACRVSSMEFSADIKW
jgi:hypothetical protein